ncbi:MAG: amidase [Rhodospirillaceae bacterium]|jgi:aspartyl-tRNA(Asn)/glutamyl-tRNA(Gln) amidotransferase subunit A|nr:amidase [Rhodospirillaceae bacterium]MBT3495504.1 amidase [Rhodospirillaceae bacterium]MBT3780066.1 amidase [Rhodospirillaceae bacterium]MBT3975453.1 amidase [Rhodospirillaceae bacterium]MBT4170815.1 amidase [Rhodospirillaceae bacterium]
MRDIVRLSATDLAGEIRAGRISPTEALDATLAHIEKTNPPLNAFITISAERAREEAAAAETMLAAGNTASALPPLLGVPYTVKDLVDTAGVRTTYASAILEHNVPARDAIAVTRMKNAGAVLVGKVSTPEFGHKPMNESPLFGRTLNPWDLTRTSGGSSGGSAAALASGMAPLSIGTDAGGSIRIPAACCGVVGMKGTMGLVPHDTAPDGFGNFSNLGPMARTVSDAALMLSVMAGPHPNDPHSHGLPIDDYVAAASGDGDLSGIKIGWISHMGNELIDPEVLEACTLRRDALAAAGAEIIPFDEPFENTEPYWLVITQSLWVARFEDKLAEFGARMTPTLLRGIEEGKTYSAVELQRAITFRTQLYRRIQSWFERVDFLMMPTLSRTAINADHDFYQPITIGNQTAGGIRQTWYPYTHPFNMTGHPAITVPCGIMADGLPAGLQIVGPMMADAGIIHLAAMVERAHPWAHLWPDGV